MSNSLNSSLFSTPAMTRVFSAQSQLRAMMRFEWALTAALESAGLAEAGSSAAMEAFLNADFVDNDALLQAARQNGNIAIPFVKQLTAAVKTSNEGASRSIHLGATSQDVLDTALVLQMREAMPLLQESLRRLEDALVLQIKAHAETMLSGRTWLQAGPPTTLGLKLAGTLAALRRGGERLRVAAERACVLQFGGAVGTLSALGDAGGIVSAELARHLQLREPAIPWHTQRDSLTEIVEALALLTGSLAKFAGDIALLMQKEIGEAAESGDQSRGGSSTMPHKHNPVACAAVLAAHARMPGLVATMLAAMPQQHERGLGLWQAEWETVPEAFRITAAALAYGEEIARDLQVDAARMQSNVEAMLGLPQSEAVSVALAQKTGRAAAHDLLRDAAARAQRDKIHLGQVLKQMPEVTRHLSGAEIDRLLDPRNYLGSTQRFIAQVLGDADANR
jgi:3-carboxy-cis,cis-muconate cycloisomerase